MIPGGRQGTGRDVDQAPPLLGGPRSRSPLLHPDPRRRLQTQSSQEPQTPGGAWPEPRAPPGIPGKGQPRTRSPRPPPGPGRPGPRQSGNDLRVPNKEPDRADDSVTWRELQRRKRQRQPLPFSPTTPASAPLTLRPPPSCCGQTPGWEDGSPLGTHFLRSRGRAAARREAESCSVRFPFDIGV